MPAGEGLATIRSFARSFEEGLSPKQRKRLGQFFTGLPLGMLLAQLAYDDDCRTVIDPMAGHGDLLDAVAAAVRARGANLDRVDGIELDADTAAFCRRRTAALQKEGGVAESRILPGSAFDPSILAALNLDDYDLVITNPPFVRYQSQNGNGANVDDVRRNLSIIVDKRLSGDERALWQTLVEGYSGLADLSVPAWLLSALLTRPGGRLALVVPATWRSRDYADVVRYLLLRLFALEFMVADTQPGWFSDALVRTHLIVARRLPWDEAAQTLSDRVSWPSVQRLQIAPTAASAASLVGAAFPSTSPEKDFVAWARANPQPVTGIDSQIFSLKEEWKILEQRLVRKPWFHKAEDRRDAPRFFSFGGTHPVAIPENLRAMLPPDAVPAGLQTLDEAGVRVSQGLRTGCNRFFYMTFISDDGNGMVTVEASESFQNRRFRVPIEALRPVLHRQADMQEFADGQVPATRALDLSQWTLPEDQQIVVKTTEAYRKRGIPVPQTMPDELTVFVRLAAGLALDPKEPDLLIPDLTAVRTNVRQPSNGRDIPTFWYMLPAFKARHLPAIFVPRINHGTPSTALNTQPPILVDANFSTIWPEREGWSNHALFALFNSSWCRAGMESAGTPLGGGALKLEATHIRQIPVPILTDRDRQNLNVLGRRLASREPATHDEINLLILAAICPGLDDSALKSAALHIEAKLQVIRAARQRIAS